MSGTDMLKDIDHTIETVELFRFDATKARHYSYGTWSSRQHAFLKLGSAGCGGWGENRMSANNPDADMAAWGECFKAFQGMKIADALVHTRAHIDTWESRQSEMAEMALIDLGAQLLGKPALELLDLEGREPVPGLFCILENEPERVRHMAEEALRRNLRTHVKVKLFGDTALDVRIVQAARDVLGRDTFLVGDVNGGYRTETSEEPIDEIAVALGELFHNGLNACEDPAYLTFEQWAQLQDKVYPLALIPDYPIRPALSAARTIVPGMGRIFNIHPGCTASILDTVTLARRIRELGAGLMIGDDSYIGPAATQWQQIAIGLGADWVEALERTDESDSFATCIKSQATYQGDDGRMAMRESVRGFGLELDEDRLRTESVDYVRMG
ncbi:MAG: hypothetical protein GF331_08200 [Chitinivibrionales bacterium]|nr:hypothetical protein [Chitinivibrionales bacterium]